MILRPLKLIDATYMLEWMHDDTVVEKLNGNFKEKTLSNCRDFIQESWKDNENIHLAIEIDSEYAGTISFKNIETERAEFAIVIRKKYMGQGIANEAMKQMIEYGWDVLELKEIYWYVNPDNIRAIHFYDKNGYIRVDNFEEYACDNKYIWYSIKN